MCTRTNSAKIVPVIAMITLSTQLGTNGVPRTRPVWIRPIARASRSAPGTAARVSPTVVVRICESAILASRGSASRYERARIGSGTSVP